MKPNIIGMLTVVVMAGFLYFHCCLGDDSVRRDDNKQTVSDIPLTS